MLPPSGATAAGTPYAGDPGSAAPVTPSATPELPPGGRDDDDCADPPRQGGNQHADELRFCVADAAHPRILALTSLVRLVGGVGGAAKAHWWCVYSKPELWT